MKEFERFLKYAGVDHLPPDKKKIYRFDSERKADASKLKSLQLKKKERQQDEGQLAINKRLNMMANKD
jgi:hypothetical protein